MHEGGGAGGMALSSVVYVGNILYQSMACHLDLVSGILNHTEVLYEIHLFYIHQ